MNDDTESLFPEGEIPREEPEAPGGLTGAVWTANKAALIQRYLRYFVYITRHGTYIDCFAGAQEAENPESWAAKLVLESEPMFLRRFVLFEQNRRKIRQLNDLRERALGMTQRPRDIRVFSGDMNVKLVEYLRENPIREKEATFCLLDQHTFECDWETVRTIAAHKPGRKIELFYFLAAAWMDRAAAGMRIDRAERLAKWWGNDRFERFFSSSLVQRGLDLRDRFKRELGYKSAHAYPIYEKDPSMSGTRGRVMFWMVHGSDHNHARNLMCRAYNKAVAPLETAEQMQFDLGDIIRDVGRDTDAL